MKPVNGPVRYPVSQAVWEAAQVRNQAVFMLNDQVWMQVTEQVFDQVENQVWWLAGVHVRNQVRDQIWGDLL